MILGFFLGGGCSYIKRHFVQLLSYLENIHVMQPLEFVFVGIRHSCLGFNFASFDFSELSLICTKKYFFSQ